MKAVKNRVVIQPAVVEETVTLTLTIEEARTLRAVFGKQRAGYDGDNRQWNRAMSFLSELNGLFPGDAVLDGFNGISTYVISFNK